MLNSSWRRLPVCDGFRMMVFIPDTSKWEFVTMNYSREFVYLVPKSLSFITIERLAHERLRRFQKYASQACFVRADNRSRKCGSPLAALRRFRCDVQERRRCCAVKRLMTNWLKWQ